MPTPILMPKLSDDMREGKILAWKKREGDAVESGEAIAEVETDKANLEVEAYSAGKLSKIIAPVGATVECGQPIAILLEEGEAEGEAAEAPAPAPAKKVAAPAQHAVPKEAAAPPDSQPAAAAVAPESAGAARQPGAKGVGAALAPAAEPAGGESVERVRASPLAKRMARVAELDLRSLEGSGPRGRVVKADVERAMASGEPRPAAAVASEKSPRVKSASQGLRDQLVPMSGMRRTIARRMAEAKPGAPHFYLTIDVEMTKALELRAQLNEQVAEEWGGKVSVNDLVLRAAALSLPRRPEVNASLAGESVQRHGAVHLGFAVSVEDGLLTPVIRDADRIPFSQLVKKARELAERARARKLKPDEYQGGTFTVSNLGMYGVTSFSAIINPGEAAILAVGAVGKRAVVSGDELRVGSVMTATLSGDHRIIDGALGAQLLQAFKALLEQPLRLLS